jgi:TnpA family transposase
VGDLNCRTTAPRPTERRPRTWVCRDGFHFGREDCYPALEPLIGERIDVGQIESQWDELLRLATSIRQGTVTASLVLRKLASYPRQDGFAGACARSVGSTAHGSCSNGCKVPSSDAASPSV